MQVFGYTLTITKAASPSPRPLLTGGGGGWFPIVREPFAGAWQQNLEIRAESILQNHTVFSCITRISQDIAKCRLRLVVQDAAGIWTETKNPAFSPVLRAPNHYQTPIKFVERWIASKLTWGNTYVLKQRDDRGVVRKLYVLDPARVKVLVAPGGDVLYECTPASAELCPRLAVEAGPITIPAREIIHDRMVCLFHDLIGVSPLFAACYAAGLAQAIQKNAISFFASGSNPGGVLSAPGHIEDDTAQRLKAYWDTNYTGANVGKVAVLGDGLKYEQLSINAVDAQLVEQLNLSDQIIAECYGVPLFLLNSTKGAPYANNEPLLQLYYAQCLQSLMVNLESTLDVGLGLVDPIDGTQYGTELDIDDLIWMDTATRTKAAADGIGAGALTPNEARRKYFGLGPVTGGDTPYMQQQNYSLAALAKRDAQPNPFASSTAAPPAPPPPPAAEDDEEDDELEAASVRGLARKVVAGQFRTIARTRERGGVDYDAP